MKNESLATQPARPPLAAFIWITEGKLWLWFQVPGRSRRLLFDYPLRTKRGGPTLKGLQEVCDILKRINQEIEMPKERLAKPPFAAYIWVSGSTLCLEWPCPEGGNPCITEYPLTEGGLGKAVNALRQLANKDAAPPMPGHARVVASNVTRFPTQVNSRRLPVQSPAMEAAVARVLAKMKG